MSTTPVSNGSPVSNDSPPNGHNGINGTGRSSPTGFIVNTEANGVILKGNNTSKGWVVQKFGGTSVGKFPMKIARDIVK